MIKLSVVIITYNEEQNIERCLCSVEDIADEIVVLDSFSTDKTEEICSKFKVNFVKHDFDNFAAQKNRAVSYTANDYVLSLDADEALSDKLKQTISELDGNSFYDAYIFNRLNIYCGKPIRNTSWYPDKKIRLWNKNKGKWSGDIHETVFLESGSNVKYLKGDLLHYSFNSIEEHISQANKFSSVGAEQLIKLKKKNLLLKAIFNPTFRFIKNYFIKGGIFGGYTGLMLSIIISFETFLKYSKAVYLKKKSK